VLDASGSASAETRESLSSAIARVGGHIEDGTDPSADLTAYLGAAKAVQDSHAEAVAAAAAAAAATSGTGTGGRTVFGGFPRNSYEEAYWQCHEGFPDFIRNQPWFTSQFPCTVVQGDGTTYSWYS
jgi:hypothetical protein